MLEVLPSHEGLRARKRREMHDRLADIGLHLFLAKGYDATTLDEIAAAAGISRRTIFYYFKSKDEILHAHLKGYDDELKRAVSGQSAAQRPIDVAQTALVKMSTRFDPSLTMGISRLIRENYEVLRRRRTGDYRELELALYEGLCGLWPAKERREQLRLVALASIGALRVAVDVWHQEDGRRPLARHIQNAFKKLKAEI